MIPARAAPTPARPAPAARLQRSCACESDDLQHRKRLSGPPALQAKPSISRPGDPCEREADRLAERALGGRPGRGPISPAPQAAMRTPTDTDPRPDIPPAVGQTTRQPGRPLDPATRRFMESRLGYDFGRVRLHTDPLAAESARQVNALAYTLGRHVVFASGRYQPEAAEGRRLLAHELVHTVQQADGPVVRRQADLAVRGLPDERAGEPDFVFFDIDRPSPADVPPENALDPDEETKAEDKAQEAVDAGDQELSLYGFASEEGGAAHNTALVERRMDAVQNVLVREGFGPPRTIHRNARLACSSDKYDYRLWRVVEMQRGTAASTRTCTTSAGAQPTTCAADVARQVTEVRDRAIELIDDPQNGALARLDRYRQNQAGEPDVQAALDRYFGNSHTLQTAQAVRDRVAAIRDFLQAMGPSGSVTFLCGTLDEPTCNTGSPANASHRLQRVTICPSFFDNPDYADKREEILIHEASHGSSLPTRDRGYQAERVILVLNTQQALDNAQSLTMFILDLNGRARPLGPETPDTVSGCNPARERLVREAIAWAERWNTYAMYGTAQTYGNARNRAAMAPYHQAHFGRSDQAAIAGLYDRYRVMTDWFDRFYAVRCTPANDPSCSTRRAVRWTLTTPATAAGGGPEPAPAASSGTPSAASGSGGTAQAGPAGPGGGLPAVSAPATGGTPAGEITVCPAFFNLSTLYDRAVEMHSGLAVNLPGIPEGISRSYARLAYNYKTEFWGVN